MTDLALNIYTRTVRRPDEKDKHEVTLGGITLEALSPAHAYTLAHKLKLAIDTHTTAGAEIVQTP